MNESCTYSKISILLILSSALLICCKSPEKEDKIINTVISEKPEILNPPSQSPENKEWKEISTANSGILLDIRYATTNNFTGIQIYDCPRCYLRPEIADKLIQLNQYILDKYQYKIKVFDCYRPKPAQQKLWDIVPDSIYVSPPARGSMHNRGMAVDLTLTDRFGTELNMGTTYDFFGRAAHIDNFDHPEEVLKNRALLQELMRSAGFQTIQSEWWHFYSSGKMFPLSDWEWPCE